MDLEGYELYAKESFGSSSDGIPLGHHRTPPTDQVNLSFVFIPPCLVEPLSALLSPFRSIPGCLLSGLISTGRRSGLGSSLAAIQKKNSCNLMLVSSPGYEARYIHFLAQGRYILARMACLLLLQRKGFFFHLFMGCVS